MVNIFDPAILGSYASSLFAVLIALYNFYKARESAKLTLSPIVEMGIMQLEKKFFFYIPMLINNAGSQPGYLEWIDLYFEDVETIERFPFYVTKKVEGRKINEIKSILPLFPIVIPGHDTTSVVFEFTQGKKKKILVDRDYRGVFTFYYNDDKKLTQEISFEFKSSFFSATFSNIKWNSLKQRVTDQSDYPGVTLFGKDMST
ncbi:MAG: hypothetical protein ACFE9L_21350 [Candidatus Hodarchaeota archaeon]